MAPLATWLGLLMIVLLAGFAVLAALGHDPQNGWVSNGPWIAMALVFAGVGVVLARHEPKNSIGWLLLAVGLSFMASTDGSAYLVLDYRAAHGLLPLGPEMLGLSGLGFTSFVLIGIPILVFPTGHVPSRGWRWTLWVFLGLGICPLCAASARERPPRWDGGSALMPRAIWPRLGIQPESPLG
ncbi:MAG TPA: hypothetical protein VNH20_10245 [Candidatus Dormibacteraeota bacterium]|nr:hypothetical protein [Candidatus Dormibacteraeota bacterium]